MGPTNRLAALVGAVVGPLGLGRAAAGRPWPRLAGAAVAIRGGSSKSKDWDAFQGLAGVDPSLLTVEKTTSPKEKPPKESLVFGVTFSDHMLDINWNSSTGWGAPAIIPFQDLKISPAASVLHYAMECFEGMKAYKDEHGTVRLFRPDCNCERLNNSLRRLHMPTISPDAFTELLKKLITVDSEWIPEGEGYSLYIRPTAIGTYPLLRVGPSEEVKLFVILSPVGPYYKEGFKPIKLFADTENVRAWPGGMGWTKSGGNYAPTIRPQVLAMRDTGCSQVLWLSGDEHLVTEVGAMNVFFAIKAREEDGGRLELVTSALESGEILHGVTRKCVLELAREWGEFDVSERDLTMGEVVEAATEGRLMEAFGTGTAAVVAPVKAISYKGEDIVLPTGEEIGPLAKRFWDTITGIQTGRIEHPWSVKVEVE